MFCLIQGGSVHMFKDRYIQEGTIVYVLEKDRAECPHWMSCDEYGNCDTNAGGYINTYPLYAFFDEQTEHAFLGETKEVSGKRYAVIKEKV